MLPTAIVINVARGGVVDEEALVEALRGERIAGAAADVFVTEPATTENSPLVRASGEEWCRGKMVLSTHVAWCAQSSIDKLREDSAGERRRLERGEACQRRCLEYKHSI